MFKQIHILRIKPQQEITEEILKFCDKNNITSAVILSLLGSLQNATLSFLKELPGKYISKTIAGPLEIASGTGTIARQEKVTLLHLHLIVSNEQKTFAGHLSKGVVFSTAEVVIGELKEQIKRAKDPYTGLNELLS